MWEISGVDTARAYARRLRPGPGLAADFARSIVWSSQCMGEDAHVEEEGEVAYVRHDACPWMDWHARAGCLAEDRPGCDAWFRSAVDAVNGALGTTLEVETLSSLPEGDACCRRRLSVRVPVAPPVDAPVET